MQPSPEGALILNHLALPGPNSNPPLPKGFRPFASERRSIRSLSIVELKKLHTRNAERLANGSPSTSSFIPSRLKAEQAEIESRLLDLEAIPSLQNNLQNAHIAENLHEDVDMVVDEEPASHFPSMIEAKRRALARFSPKVPAGQRAFTWEEAEEIQRRAVAAEKERRARRPTMPKAEEQLAREEFEARMWAFMNYKPTGSDEGDSEEEDPANWFDDDQDDGVKGQDIVEPDTEDYADMIQLDASKLHYNTFYEPRDND